MPTVNTKVYSSKQEHGVASILGWDVVSGSGARPHHVGDVESREWLGECKTHVTSGHPIVFRESVWMKIMKEAMSQCKRPVLFVDDGSQDLYRTWCMYLCTIEPYGGLHTAPILRKDGTSNISFDSEDMKRQLSELSEDGKYRYCGFTTRFGLRNVVVTDFLTFNAMFGS